MPRPAHTLVTFRGIFGSSTAPLDEWSFGLRFEQNRWETSTTVANALSGFWGTHLASLHPSWVILTKVRVAAVTTTGHVGKLSTGAYQQADWDGSTAGTGAATPKPVYPPQVACAVSLLSARAGATGKGRFFLPYTQHSLETSDLRLSAGNAGIIADAVKAFVNAVGAYNPAGSTFGGSPAAQVVSSKGYMSPVSSIRVGRALDTLRSRRSELPEGYVVRPL